MSILACPVCRLPLTESEGRFSCECRHSFDTAREGYVNLLQNAKGQHGDNRLMLDGRRRFLEAGHYAPLKEAVSAAVKTHARQGAILLDAGCGEGYYTEALTRAASSLGGTLYAFDVSRDAVRYAAKRKCGTIFWILSIWYSVSTATKRTF